MTTLSNGNGSSKEWMLRILLTLLGISVGVLMVAVGVKGDIADNRGLHDVNSAEHRAIETRLTRLENNYEKILDKLDGIDSKIDTHDRGNGK